MWVRNRGVLGLWREERGVREEHEMIRFSVWDEEDEERGRSHHNFFGGGYSKFGENKRAVLFSGKSQTPQLTLLMATNGFG